MEVPKQSHFFQGENIILQTKSLENIPENAQILSKWEAINFRLKQIDDWKPKSDVWAIRFGSWILGVVAVIPSISIAQFYRRKLKLRSQGFYTMYAALTYSPLFMATGAHYQFVTLSLAALRADECPICTETRAGIIQSLLSTAYPTLLAGFSGLMFASRHGTVYDLPYYKDYKGVVRHYYQLTKPLFRRLGYIFMIEFIFANFITYLEAKQFYSFQEKLVRRQMEKTNQF